jgi:hypothetical protein
MRIFFTLAAALAGLLVSLVVGAAVLLADARRSDAQDVEETRT